jgi:hypothetical protein
MVTMPSASQVVVFGVSRHVALEFRPTPEVASAPVPVRVVNVAVPPGITALDSGVAVGAPGRETVGVIVAPVTCPVESATTYFTGEASPVKEGSGSKVTVPFALTVYVPSPEIVNVVRLQLALAVLVVAHNFTLLAIKVAGDVTVSFVKMEIV